MRTVSGELGDELRAARDLLAAFMRDDRRQRRLAEYYGAPADACDTLLDIREHPLLPGRGEDRSVPPL